LKSIPLPFVKKKETVAAEPLTLARARPVFTNPETLA